MPYPAHILEDDTGTGYFAPEFIGDAADGGFDYRRMRYQGVLNLDGAYPVGGDFNHLIGPARKEEIAVFVLIGGITGKVNALRARLGFPVVPLIPFGIAPQRRRQSRKWFPDDDRPFSPGRERNAVRLIADTGKSRKWS